MPTNSKHTLLRWLPAAACMALLFWLSSQPDLPRPASNVLNLVLRKSAHFTAYGVLALCYLFGLGDSRPWHRWLALGLTLLYAISDEYHQSWTPNRQPAATDVMIDTVGALTAIGLWSWLANKPIGEKVRSWAVGYGLASGEKHA